MSLPIGKLPFMQFYPADWLADTGPLSLATRGLWIDCLCVLWPIGEKTLTREQWARMLRCTTQEFDAALMDLCEHKTAGIVTSNGDVTLIVTIVSRRMNRDSIQREHWRKRQRKHRYTDDVTHDVTHDVTLLSRDGHTEKREKASPPLVSSLSSPTPSSLSSLNPQSPSKREKLSLCRSSILPDDFKPNERHDAMALGTNLNVHLELAAFKDFHTAKGTVFKDWNAAFRTWLRNAVKFNQRRTP